MTMAEVERTEQANGTEMLILYTCSPDIYGMAREVHIIACGHAHQHMHEHPLHVVNTLVAANRL